MVTMLSTGLMKLAERKKKVEHSKKLEWLLKERALFHPAPRYPQGWKLLVGTGVP